MGTLKFALAVALARLPSWAKIPIYRVLFGYRIGRGVRIGLSPFVGVGRCRIGDGTRIGSFNLFCHTEELDVGREVRIGFLNVFRGGRQIRVGDYCSVLRRNTVNSIIDRDFVGPAEATFSLGTGSVLSSGHWLDFSAGIEIGGHVIVGGGLNSSFWTHNRQRGRGITVGCHTYFGSEVRLYAGVEVAPLCIVALGSVLSGAYEVPRSLIGGNPATAVRSLSDRDLFLVTNKTRRDIPDDVATALLPDDLKASLSDSRGTGAAAHGPEQVEEGRRCAESLGSSI